MNLEQNTVLAAAQSAHLCAGRQVYKSNHPQIYSDTPISSWKSLLSPIPVTM